MRSILLTALLLSFSAAPALAETPEDAISALLYNCLGLAKTKLSRQAKAYGCVADLSKYRLTGVDSREPDAPSTYAWFSTTTNCSEPHSREIQVLVQWNSKTRSCL